MRIQLRELDGSALCTPEAIQAAAGALQRERNGDALVVVTDAAPDRRGHLEGLIALMAKAPDPRETAAVLASAERECAALLAIALAELGCEAITLAPEQLQLRHESSDRLNVVVEFAPEPLLEHLRLGRVVVVPAGQGVDATGRITRLGRSHGTGCRALGEALRASGHRVDVGRAAHGRAPVEASPRRTATSNAMPMA